MAAIQDASDLSDDRVLDCDHAGPTVLRMMVGLQLRRLRESGGITCESAGESIRASHSKISRMEMGRTGFKPRDVADLLTLYGVGDGTVRESLLAMAKKSNAPGWWHAYGDVLPGWFEAYVGLEQAASVIRSYEVQFVPGLLQTEDYARATIRLGHQNAPGTEMERRVGLRMRRQRILTRPDPPMLWAVLDEAALRRPIGGAATMRAQIQHLIKLAELPHVTIQVMPFSAGGHAAAGGPVTILRFPENELPDVVYLEQLTSALYPDREADIEGYWHVMNRLVVEAEPPTETSALLRRVLKET
jgi:hypothetical protein